MPKRKQSGNEKILALHRAMEIQAHKNAPSESHLSAYWEEIKNIDKFQKQAGDFLTARLAELLLYSAGSYADQVKFTLAGDLLFNPRLVLVHIKGRATPVVKKRHTPLTTQFQEHGNTKWDVVSWLKNNTWVEVKQKALLPRLEERLKYSCFLSPTYLKTISQKAQKISDTLAFMTSCGLSSSLDFGRFLANRPQTERNLYMAKLCRFDLGEFIRLGNLALKNLQDTPQNNHIKEAIPASLGEFQKAPLNNLKSFLH